MKQSDAFRDFVATERACVQEFYREHHRRQTLDFVLAKKAEYLPLRRCRMGAWEALERLDVLVDESDPDLELSQLDHALQTAEAMRRDDRPRWMVLCGLIHDLGKVLALFGEPQWAVVGDTQPVGCAFDERVVHSTLFADNPDAGVPEYVTPTGIYAEGCGLDQVHLSWGHDEYLYHVLREHLSEEALFIVRYHSFYAWHREGAYARLANARDRRLHGVLRTFNAYDLYSKSAEPPDRERLRPWYEALVAEFLPPVLQW